MKTRWLGLKNYEDVYFEQKESLLWPSDLEEIWGVEHPEVITLGRRFLNQENFENDFPKDRKIVKTDRGGLATLHNPGQLVIYPLLSLRKRSWGAREYVIHLLTGTQNLLQNYGINSEIDENQSGLFIRQFKVCFLGLRVSRGRCYHGLSINVSNDLKSFGNFSSCGLKNRPTTSLHQLGVQLAPQTVFEDWVHQVVGKNL